MLVPPSRRGAARRPAPWGPLIGLALLPRLTLAADNDEAINIRGYQAAHHGVVNITNVGVDDDLFFRPYSSESTGSGVMLDTNGRILTNHHAVDQAAKLEVTRGGRTRR